MICRLWSSSQWAKKLLRTAIAALILLSAVSALPAQAVLSGATRTQHFLIRYEPDLRATASVLGQACEGWLAEISRKLQLESKPDSLIPVFLYRNQGEFSKATGYDRPGQVLGRASSRGYVELDASGIFASAEQIAGHEIVHVVIFRILGPNSDALPLWFNEGTAKFLTNDFDQIDRTVLADAITSGTLLPLPSLAANFPKGDQQTLAYAEGTSAITYLVKSHGEHALAQIIHETARTGSFDAAMRKVIGESPDEFERKWRLSLEGRYGFPRLMQTLGRIGFMAMVVIIFAAYIAIRRRRRRLIERYQLEEEDSKR